VWMEYPVVEGDVSAVSIGACGIALTSISLQQSQTWSKVDLPSQAHICM
jgi:hypothetical protein